MYTFDVNRFSNITMNSEVLTIRVSSKLKSRLDQLGKTLCRSKSYIAERGISQFVDENAWQINELTQAEEEIKQGKFIGGDEVNRYLDSWGTSNERKAPKV